MLDWNQEIRIARQVREEISRLDVDELWPFEQPRAPASAETIAAAERRIGTKLPAQYVDFLRHADGWPSFYHAMDLLGCEELGSGARWDYANVLLRTVVPIQARAGTFRLEELLPIMVADQDIDVFVIVKTSFQNAGNVYWLAGQLVQEFRGFEAFFLAMVDYNRKEVHRLKTERA